MPCSRDVEKAILDKNMQELTALFIDNRPTFSRVSEDTIQINGRVDNSKTKAQHRQQARAIANNLISRTKESFQGMVNGYVTEHSEYDPLLVTFKVNPLYVQHEFSKLSNKDYNESPNSVDYQLKSADILASNRADEIFRKGDKNNWDLDKIMNELQIPKEQQQLLKSYNTRNREQLLTNLLADYSYVVEINTASQKISDSNFMDEHDVSEEDLLEHGITKDDKTNTQYYSNLTVPGGTNYTENEIATPAITPSIKGHAQFATDNGIGWFRSDEQVLNGKQDLSNNIQSTGNPEIDANNIEGIDEDGYPVFKTNPKTVGGNSTKTRRILEVQSDLFQKGRDNKNLIRLADEKKDRHSVGKVSEELSKELDKHTFGLAVNDTIATYGIKTYKRISNEWHEAEPLGNYIKPQNQFLQLLNKDNNWVSFFIKSIIQDSQKKGYEKVLFPVGDTAAKIEGYETVQGFIDNKENRIEELNDKKFITLSFEKIKEKSIELENITVFGLIGEQEDIYEAGKSISAYNKYIKNKEEIFDKNKNNEIKQLEKEIEDAKAGKLKISSIAKFYEETIQNVLKKNSYKPERITDEYGNSWNQVKVVNANISSISLSPNISNEEERDNVNNDSTSANSNRFSLSPNSIPTTGVFENYIQFKYNKLVDYERRISIIKSDKKKKGVSEAELNRLNNEKRELDLLVEGNKELGIEGLKNEIENLKLEGNINAIGYYAEKDIKRLDALSYSNDIDDIREAQTIIKLYEQAGTFRKDQYNPFFEEDEMFLKDQNSKLTTTFAIDKATIDQFEDWKRTVMGYQNILDQKFQDLAVNEINSNPLVKNTYGDKHFNIDEITYKEKGLKDVDFLSMYTMDITHGIASHNGIIPQVMFSVLSTRIESKSSWSRGIGEYVDEHNPKIQKALMDLGHTLQGLGILGIKGASFNLFKQISKEGNETNDLVQRHTKEYVDQKSKALYKFNKDFSAALTYQDYETRQKAINSAFERLKQWRINNSIIIDPSRLDDKSYQDELVKMLGQKGYEEEVAEQNRLTKEYEDYRQGLIDRQIVIEGKNTYDELSDESKNKIKLWENNYDPKKGYEDYHSVSGLFFGDRKSNNYMKYNNFVAREFKPNVAANIESNKYEISNTDVETGHLDKNYTTIQSNPVLADFYSKVKEFCEVFYESLPYDIQEQTNMYTLPGLLKTSAELINDKSTSLLSSMFLAFRHMMDRVRTNFGVAKQGDLAYTTTDPITGKETYKVNDGFIRNNRRAISNRVLIERTKFLQAYNSTRKTGQLADIKYGTNVKLSNLNTSSLVQLAQYLHADITLDQIRSGDLSAIKSRLNGDVVDIGRLITDFSQHSIVQTQSFDLPKLMKYFSDVVMAYSARQEALPILEILRKQYDKTENPKTNNIGKGIFNKIEGKFAKVGVRTGAYRQMDDWFERVPLNNYQNKHVGVLGRENKADGTIPKFGRNIYTSDERKEYNELQELIKNETDEKRRDQLINKREALGKTRTATALYDNMLNWIRTLRLGYNLSSMTTNFLEGVTSNMILGASDEYFDPKEIFYGYRVVKHSFIKNITFGYVETGLAKKNRSLTNKFDVIIDSRNDLQKNSAGSYGDKLSWTNKFAGNQRVEYINQSPLMIAILRTMKLKDKDGNESSIWDAYNNEGHLKDEFKTPENIENWEALEGDQYKIFKSKLGEVINLGHGNYSALRGMMAKSSSMGKAGLMFKSWLPEALYWRFGKEQDNIGTGQIGVKGRYWSYGAGTAGVHGAAVGAAIFGPVGALVGWGIGATAGAAMGTDTGVGLLRETLDATRLLVKKMIGMPINLIVGKQVIDISKKQLFEKGDYFNYNKSDKFTIQDQRNLNANMADISLQLAWIGLMLMVKHIFWDDDDKAKDPERIAHNILVNKLMQLSSQASSYVNPKEMFNTISSLAVVQYIGEVGKELIRVQKYYDGEDIIQTGIHTGESGLANQTKKILLPGLFKEGLNPSKSMLGFGGMAERVYPNDSPFQKYFHSDAYKDEQSNKRERAARRRELADNEEYKDMEEDEKKREIEKVVNSELPTPNKLEKLGETREEYLQENK